MSEEEEFIITTVSSKKKQEEKKVEEEKKAKQEEEKKAAVEEIDEMEGYEVTETTATKTTAEILSSLSLTAVERFYMFSGNEFLSLDWKNKQWKLEEMRSSEGHQFLDNAAAASFQEWWPSKNVHAFFTGGIFGRQYSTKVFAIKMFLENEKNIIAEPFDLSDLSIPRACHVAAVIKYQGKHQLIVAGGKTSEESFAKSVQILDLTKPFFDKNPESWKNAKWQNGPNLPEGRVGSSCVSLHGCLYMFGGVYGVSQSFHPELSSTSVLRFDSSSSSWNSINIKNLKPVANCSTILTKDDKVLIFGGTDGIVIVGDLIKVDLEKQEAEELPITDPCAMAKLALFDDTLIVVGGALSDGSNYQYDLKKKQWSPFEYSHSEYVGEQGLEGCFNCGFQFEFKE